MANTLEAFFEVIIKRGKDIGTAYGEIFGIWLEFEKYCKMPMASCIKDLPAIICKLL